MPENFSDRRVELAKKFLGIDPGDPGSKIGVGDWQEVVTFGDDHVLKKVMPHNFSYIEKPGSKVNALQLKRDVERHTTFLYKMFGGLFPKPRVFLSEKKSPNGEAIFIVYKLQRNIEKMKFYDNRRELPNDFYLTQLLNSDPKLRSQFFTLYRNWKVLREIGLSLDISSNRNCCIFINTKNGLEFKIFNSIPLYLIDKELYEKSTIPKSLIVLDVEQIPNGKGPKESKDFYDFLEKYFS